MFQLPEHPQSRRRKEKIPFFTLTDEVDLQVDPHVPSYHHLHRCPRLQCRFCHLPKELSKEFLKRHPGATSIAHKHSDWLMDPRGWCQRKTRKRRKRQSEITFQTSRTLSRPWEIVSSILSSNHPKISTFLEYRQKERQKFQETYQSLLQSQR